MSLGHGYKATYDYVELTVEQQQGGWRLTLTDNKHKESVVHEFSSASEARGSALALAQHHINVQHNDTLIQTSRLTWQEY